MSPKKSRSGKSKRLSTKAVKAIVKKTMIKNSDEKYYYATSGLTATNFSATPSAESLATIAVQGVGDDERIGDEVRLQTLRIKLRIVIGSSPSPDVFRILVVRWKPFINTVPTIDQILKSATSLDYQTAMSPYNYKNNQQYVIHKDIYSTLTTSDPVRAYNLKIKLNNVLQKYTGNFCTNRIFIYFIGEASTQSNTYVMSSELKYFDA